MRCKSMQVLDLFHTPKLKLPIKEWVEVDKKLPSVKNGIFKVRLPDETEFFAYFYQDGRIDQAKHEAIIGAERICDCTAISSNWWHKETGEPLTITHWGVFDEKRTNDT